MVKMKIVAFLAVAVLVVGIVGVSSLAFADTEDDPQVQTLYAGQDIEVGFVEVWNDEETLYVKYTVTEEDWFLTEVHVHVGESLDDFPLAGRWGNPAPGLFECKEYFELADQVTEWTVEVDLGDWEAGAELIVAAHAEVVRPIEDCWEIVWQIGDVEEVNAETGWLENYADEFNWGEPAGPITMGPSLAVEEPPFTDPFIVGETSDDEFPYNSNTVRGYATDFDVQWSGSLPFGGLLTVSWSPGQSAFERKVVSGDGISTVEFTATGTAESGEGWFMDTYPLVQHTADVDPLGIGVHTINFQHTQGDGTFWDWIRLEKPCEQWETAWAEGTRFTEQGNWATYFSYTVQGWELIDTFEVPATTATPTLSNEVLEAGIVYKIEAVGTYFFRTEGSSSGYIADAEWALRYDAYGSGWTKGDGSPYSSPYNGLDLCFDADINTDWGDFNEDHTYSVLYTGEGSEVSLFIKDSQYGDNSGGLTVNIYEWK